MNPPAARAVLTSMMGNEVPHKSVRWGCLFCIALGGCAQSSGEQRQVRFVKSKCRRVTSNGHLEALAFSSSFTALGLDGQQLVYNIVIFGSDRRPIKSDNGAFQDASGNVSCGRTLIVRPTPDSEQVIAVRLPASELKVEPSALPVYAQMGVYLPDQTRLAWHRMRLPYQRSDSRPEPKSTPEEQAEEISTAPRSPDAGHQEPSATPVSAPGVRGDARADDGTQPKVVSAGDSPRVSLPDGLPTPVHSDWRQIVPRLRDGVAFVDRESRPRQTGGNP
ncbi:MAG: hypothetical protein O7F76_00255 [Planctomycetota bacterium]|nr:hypothetical protein [Planctomycetota bacterium]